MPARDAADTIGRTLSCLARQENAPEFEVIVVDDGSRDPTAQVVARASLPVRLVRLDRAGAAEARNTGARESTGRALAFLDADCFPTPGWLAAGIHALQRAQLVQGRVLPDPAVPVGPFDRTLWITSDIGLWQTANLFITGKAFDGVGGFEDWLPVELGKLMAEDVWFGWRVHRTGARTAFSADALAHHAVFRRGPREYLGERRRVRYFPAIAAKTPELRRTMFFKRLFLSRRSAAFDAGVTGSLAAALLRSRLPLVAWAPYALVAWRTRLRHHGRGRAALVAAVDAAADLLALVELVRGSSRARTIVL